MLVEDTDVEMAIKVNSFEVSIFQNSKNYERMSFQIHGVAKRH